MKKPSSKMIPRNRLFYIRKNVYLMRLVIFTLVLGGLFSSCGFLGTGVGNTFSNEDSTVNGNPGDGDTPSLSSRFETDPELADTDCDGNDRCEDVCENIYDDSDSEDTCKNLTIGRVAKIEEVFYALVSGDLEKLEDIDEDDLEDFLDIGLDGWKVRVINKQKSYDDRSARFLTTLRWVVDQESVVIPALESEDRNSEILTEVFLAYCHIDKPNGSGGCDGASRFSQDLYRNAGQLMYGSPTAKAVAYIENEDDRYSLFEALRYAGVKFFERAALSRRYDAFGMGNKVLEKLCTHTNNNSVDQCVRAFYCWLDEQTGDMNNQYQAQIFAKDKVIQNIGREIQLNCTGLADVSTL